MQDCGCEEAPKSQYCVTGRNLKRRCFGSKKAAERYKSKVNRGRKGVRAKVQRS